MKTWLVILMIALSIGFAGTIRAQKARAQSVQEQNADAPHKEEQRMSRQNNPRIRLIFGDAEAIAALDDHPASHDFISMLPLTLSFDDYNGTEKISYPPRKLKIQGSPDSCAPEAGSVAYYAPWGNLAIFYRDFRHSNGLVPLGRITSGMEKLAAMRGKFSVRVEKMD